MKRLVCILLLGALAALTAAAQSTPVLGLMSPNSASAGAAGVTLSITGANLAVGAIVLWAGAPLQTSYVATNLLTAVVPASYLASAGSFAVSVQNPDGNRSNTFIFTVTSPPLSVATTSLPSATAGTAYSATLAASAGSPPYSWAIADGNFPSGLTLNANGTISGTPGSAGSYSFTVRVTDQLQQSAVKTLVLTVTAPPLSIATNSPLPSGMVRNAYTQTFQVSAGSPPFTWSSSGALPAGLTLNSSTGVLSGTPTASGTFSFTVQVKDGSGTTANKSFSLTIQAPPLVIDTAELFNGTVGVTYAQTFSASGGVSPYRWALSGQIGALTFDASTATISGTPTTAATYSFTVQVTDSAGTTVSKPFTLVIDVPRLNILNASPLPAGAAETSYSYRFSATGGTPPYQWSISSGSAGDLTLDLTSGVLSGIPFTAGTFNFVVRVNDSTGQAVTKSFSVSISPKPLAISTSTQLPDAIVANPITQQMTATGGVLPYTWSVNGLPDGLSLDPSTGVLSGVPKVAGSFLFNVRVTDSARATVVDLFRLNVKAPTLPQINISGLPASVNAADQYTLRLALSEAYPLALNGEVVLTFTPDSGSGDNSVRFASGTRRLPFTVDAGNTQFAIDNFALQTGTVAGTIQLTVSLKVGDTDITPTPAPSFSSRVERAAAVIRSAKIVRSASTVSIQVTGYVTAREITQAVFRFKASAGTDLRTSEFTVPVEALFSTYFQGANAAQFGSQFVFTQPFTVQGDVNGVIADSVTLTNRVGSTTATVAP